MAASTGLFDQNREVWDGEVLRALPIGEEQLSHISDEPARGLRGSGRGVGHRSLRFRGSRR